MIRRDAVRGGGVLILATLGTVLAASVLVYVLTILLPGDPALAQFRARYGDSATPEPAVLNSIRSELRLDRALPVQYVGWLGDVLRGDLGHSSTNRQPVAQLLRDRLPVTLLLAFGSLGVAVVLAIPSAMLASRIRGGRASTLGVTQMFVSLPDYFLAILLVLGFAVYLQWLPASGGVSTRGLILPMVTAAAYPWAVFVRLVLAGIEEYERTDWARVARAKGLREGVILRRHILPHTLSPLISMTGVMTGVALGSVLVVEVVFAIPGVGRLMYDGVLQRDVPVVQGALLLQVTLVIVANRLADAGVRWVNPVLRTRGFRDG